MVRGVENICRRVVCKENSTRKKEKLVTNYGHFLSFSKFNKVIFKFSLTFRVVTLK